MEERARPGGDSLIISIFLEIRERKITKTYENTTYKGWGARSVSLRKGIPPFSVVHSFIFPNVLCSFYDMVGRSYI